MITCCLSAKNYYWIGGTGDWSDPKHWSLSDLGTGEPAEAIPTANDNVYFNEFSFTNDGDTVYVSATDTYCHELDWGNIRHRVALHFRPDADDNKRIHIGGSLLLSPTLEIIGDEVTWTFRAASVNNLIMTFGKTLGHVEFDSEAGEWWLFDELKVKGTVRLMAGKLNTNANNIFCTDFESPGNVSRKLALGTSTLEARNALVLENDNLNLNIGTSNLTCSVLKASGFKFNDVTLLLGETRPRIEGSGITVNNLNFGGADATGLLSSNTLNMPLDFVLPAGETLTVLGDVLVNSLCTNPVSLVSSQPGIQAYLVANNTVEVSYINIKDVAVSGGNFVAYNSSDNGNNSGWIFSGEPGGCTLTVELSEFTAECQNRNVILNWTTETEVNSAYFGIEVSSDGRNFKEITKISAAGNSTEPLDYTFVDPELRTDEQHYYRLNQIDAFNETEYSEILNVSCLPPPPDVIDIYPNPIGNVAVLHLNLPATDNVRVEVYNSFGQLLINETRLAPEGIHDLDISMFYMLPGIYIVKVYIDGRYMKKKFVKL